MAKVQYCLALCANTMGVLHQCAGSLRLSLNFVSVLNVVLGQLQSLAITLHGVTKLHVNRGSRRQKVDGHCAQWKYDAPCCGVKTHWSGCYPSDTTVQPWSTFLRKHSQEN